MTMRPVAYSFTPADESTTHFATGLTGAGPWDSSDFTRAATTDSLAHQVTLTSGSNLSGINITITGTDADGKAVTETRAGPASNTVETAAYFKTISAISAASTLGANTMDVGIADEFVSQTIPLEVYVNNEVSCQVTLGGTANFDIEDTLSDIRQSPQASQGTYTWLNDANFTGKTASLANPLAVFARAIRLAINSYSSGATLELAISTPV